MDLKLFKWSNLLQNINVCPHWYDILLHLALYFYCISKIGVHPHGWDIHLLSKQSGVPVNIAYLNHTTVCTSVLMYTPTSRASWSCQCDDV